MVAHLKKEIKAVLLCLGAALLGFAFYRVLFFLLNRHLFGWVGFGEYLRLFLIGLRFDLAGVAYFNLPYAVLALLPLPWLSRGKGRFLPFAAFMLFNGAANILASIDLIYFRYTLARSTRTLWKVAFLGDDLTPLLGPILREYWPLLVLFLAVTAGLAYAWRRAHRDESCERLTGRLVFGRLAATALTAGLLVVLIRGGVQLRPMELNTANYLAGGENVPLVTNTPYVMVRTFRKADLPKQKYFDDAKLATLLNPVREYGAGREFRPLNVVIVVMESLSREYTAPPYGKEALTPRFDALAREGLLFANAYANGKQSIEAIPAVTASIPSLTKDPFVTSNWSGNMVESLANLLGAKGYETAFYHGGRTGTMGIDGFAKAAGYKSYKGLEDFPDKSADIGEWGVPDEPYLSYFSDELGKMKKPFLATVFTLSAHHPFKLPAAWEGKFPEGKHPITKMVSYADEALGRFFEKAAKTEWFADTLFVITADHTGPSFSPEFSSRVGAYKVPILFYHKGDAALKGVSDKAVDQIDIMPTVLDYLGFPDPFFAIGESAFGGGEGFAINARNGETFCASGKYAVTRSDKELTGAYDLAADGLLASNLLPARGSEFAVADERCRAAWQVYSTAVRENKMTAARWRGKK